MNVKLRHRVSFDIDHLIRLLLLAVAIVIPALFSTAFYSVFSEPKLLALRLITGAIILVWGFKIYRDGGIIFRHNMFNILLLLWAGSLITSTIISTNLWTSLFGIETRFLGIFTMLNLVFIAFTASQFLEDQRQLRTFLWTMSITATVLAFYALLQSHGYLQENFHWDQNPLERAFGTMGHSNHFGAYLGMSVMLSLALFIIMIKKKCSSTQVLPIAGTNKTGPLFLIFGWGAAIILQFYGIILTASRGALVATVAAIIMLGLICFCHFSAKKKHPQVKKILIIALLIITFSGSTLWFFRQDLQNLPVVQRINASIQFVENGGTVDRISWWKSSLAMILSRPFLGFGLSTFRDHYNLYRRTDYRVPGDIQDEITPESSHNEYLDIAVQQGLFGLIIYLALIFWIIYQLFKMILHSSIFDEQTLLRTGVLGSLLVYLLQVIVNFGVIDTLSIFYLLLGLAVAIGGTQKTITFAIKNYGRAIILALTLVIVIAGTILAVQEAAAEISFKTATQTAGYRWDDFTQTAFSSAVLLQPFRYEYFQTYADFSLHTALNPASPPDAQIQDLTQAIELYQSAVVLNATHPSTFYNQGVALLELSQRLKATQPLYADELEEQAIASLRQSMILSPNNPLYAYQAGKNFLQMGHSDLARFAFAEALRIRPNYQDAETLLKQIEK